MTERRLQERMRGAIGALALVALVAAGCSSAADQGSGDGGGGSGGTVPTSREDLTFLAEPEGDPTTGGRLAFGLSAESDGWDVSSNRWAGPAYIVGGAIFDPLAAYDEDGNPVPYLAEEISSNEDFTEWTITLRPGVSFHNGEPVDAAALVQNLEAHQASILTASTLDPVDSITTSDDLTVVVTMNRPWSTFPHLLTSQVGYVMAPAMMDSPDGSRNPVGSGPFVFDEWQAGTFLRVSKNPSYWREGLPYLDEIEFRSLSDEQTRSRALETGSVNVIQTGGETGGAAQILKFAEQASRGEFQMYTDDDGETAETFIALNTSKPPFDDPLARQILAYGLDTETLSSQGYSGLFPPARGPFQPSSPWYVETEYPEYNLEKAMELHEEYKAKYGEPLRFTANIVPTPEIQLIAASLQEQGREAGLEVRLNAIDQAQLIAEAITGEYEATGFILFGSPILDREYVFIADSPPGQPLNFTGNSNQRLVDALDAARATDDLDEQREQYAIVQEELAKDLNFIWLVHNISAVIFDNTVFGLADYSLPDGSTGLRSTAPFLTEAWIQNN